MRTKEMIAVCGFALCFHAVGQSPSGVTDRGKRNYELHRQAEQAVDAERKHAKVDLCPKAMTTFAINECMARELKTSDANYNKLVMALGALLRSSRTEPVHGRIPFDDAEAAWMIYREKACAAAGWVNEGGSMRPMVEMGCEISVVQHHMDQLWELYSDLEMN
jgi:uncharacterized protein YecT (DUF1311 family)